MDSLMIRYDTHENLRRKGVIVVNEANSLDVGIGAIIGDHLSFIGDKGLF